jgi:5S rRNA maturation endonuclease (ribonuclease M5)
MNNLTLPTTESFDWTSKGITAKTLDIYGVGLDTNGRVISPHFSPTMELLAIHSRTPGERDFRMQGKNVPIGLHTLGNKQELIICEGHSDTYAAKQVFPHADVIGLPGSDTHLGLEPYMSHVRKYKRITIMVDGDSPGLKLRANLIAMLPKSKTYVTHIDNGNDVCNYLAGVEGGLTVDDLRKQYKLSTSNKGSSFVDEADCDKYATDKAYDVVSTGLSNLDSILGGGLGVAELTLLTGFTGTGKSAIAQQIATNVAQSGTKVLYIAGEMTPKQNLDRLVRQWTGGIVRKDELAKRYKEVASTILITKFSELSLDTVTDVIQEAVQDHGVRLVIVDVLSDIDGFINTDVTTPAKIIKKLHDAARGDELNEIPPCSLLCVAHTKGGDSETLKLDDIRGGSVIRQEATCVVGIQEVKPGDLTNTSRVVTLLKRPRNRDYEATPVYLTYDKHSHRYTCEDTTSEQVPVQPRKKLPLSVPKPNVPPESDILVGDEAEAASVPTTTEDSNTNTTTPAKTVSVTVPPRLLQPIEQALHRDEGDTQDSGQDEATTSSTNEPTSGIPISSPDDTQDEHSGTNNTIVPTEPGGEERRLNALRNMYIKHPTILGRHQRSVYKTNDAVRLQLIELGYELL